MVVFSRSTRLPPWLPSHNRTIESPITVVVDPPISKQIREGVLASLEAQLRYVAFETVVAGVPYQVIARVTYADPLREHLESVSGFTVNLDWVRTEYFADILAG